MRGALKYLTRIMPIMFGLAVFLFFGYAYKFHLHYQEQLQMFLFTSDYFSDLIGHPGGLVDYLSTFFVQFYYVAWLGALIIALLLVLLQQQVFKLSNLSRKGSTFWPLTYIPSILFGGLLCDENFLLAGLLAANITLAAVQLYSIIKKPLIRLSFGIIAIPLLFWAVGGIFWIFPLLCIVLEWRHFKQFSLVQWIISIVGAILLTVLSFEITIQFQQFPISRLWCGMCYNRYPVVAYYPFLVIWACLLLIPLVISFLPAELKKALKIIVLSSQILILLIFAKILIGKTANWAKEKIMAYDYYVRMEQWVKVISLANHQDPDSPLSVACLNLALSKSGNMGDCMFRYFQNGTEGLLPTFQRDFTMPFIAGEVYYHLGLLNTSMRYAFEAMEAIPDYKKSSRAIKRMAEVNLLNGEYKVASKYLHLLQHTFFYREWETETLKCIDDPALIEKNPEWATLKKFRITKDFLFSEQEKDQMLGMLVTHYTANKMAYEYLMAYTLLNKDLGHLIQYFPLGKELGYKEIPAHYQEALVLAWTQKPSDGRSLPWPINLAVKQNFKNYVKRYSSNFSTAQQMNDGFSQTYWYYFHFRK